MAQHDFDLANQSGAAVRADANLALLAIVSQSSGATEPATKFAYQWWADTTTGILKQRDAANAAWVNVLTLATGVSVGISAYMATVLDDADAVTAIATLGIARPPIPCTVTGTANAIILTPSAGVTSVPYVNFQKYGFVATYTSSGAVTIKITAADAAQSVYRPDGILIDAYDINAGHYYEVAYTNGVYVMTSTPQSSGQSMSNDASVRVASPSTAATYIVTYFAGNGLWLYESGSGAWEKHFVPGSFLTIDTANCTINGATGQALAVSTRYFIYAYVAAGVLAIDHSTTAPAEGDPLGATRVTGYLFKTGDITRRLIGGVATDSAGVIWSSGGNVPFGVKQSNMASYYHRQRLNLQTNVTGNSASTAWTTVGVVNGLLQGWLWGDGGEPEVTFAGTIGGSLGAAGCFVGISINGEVTPSSWVGYQVTADNYYTPFCIRVPSGNLDHGLATYQVMLKSSDAGNTVILGGAAGSPSILCLNINQ